MALRLYQHDPTVTEALTIGTVDAMAQIRFFTYDDVFAAHYLATDGSMLSINMLDPDDNMLYSTFTATTTHAAVGDFAPEDRVGGLNVLGNVRISGKIFLEGTDARGHWSKWTETMPRELVYNSHVGIGTASALQYALDVSGDLNFTGALYLNGEFVHPQQWLTSTHGAMSIIGSNVGIMVSTPTKALDVGGNINFTGGLYNNGTLQHFSPWNDGAGYINYTSNVWIGPNAPVTGSFGSPSLHVEGAVDATSNIFANNFLDAASNLTLRESDTLYLPYPVTWNGVGATLVGQYCCVGDATKVAITVTFTSAVVSTGTVYAWSQPLAPATSRCAGGSVWGSGSNIGPIGGVCIMTADGTHMTAQVNSVTSMYAPTGIIQGSTEGTMFPLSDRLGWQAGDVISLEYTVITVPLLQVSATESALVQDLSGNVHLNSQLEALLEADVHWTTWAGSWTNARCFRTGNMVTVTATAIGSNTVPVLTLPVSAASVSVGTGVLTAGDGTLSVWPVSIASDQLVFNGPWDSNSSLMVNATYLGNETPWPGTNDAYESTDTLTWTTYDPSWNTLGTMTSSNAMYYQLGETVRFVATVSVDASGGTITQLQLPVMPMADVIVDLRVVGQNASAMRVDSGTMTVLTRMVLPVSAQLTIGGTYRAARVGTHTIAPVLPLFQTSTGLLTVGYSAPSSSPLFQIQGDLRTTGMTATAYSTVATTVVATSVTITSSLSVSGDMDTRVVAPLLITSNLFVVDGSSKHAGLHAQTATIQTLTVPTLALGKTAVSDGIALDVVGRMRINAHCEFSSIVASNLTAHSLVSSNITAATMSGSNLTATGMTTGQAVFGQFVGSGSNLTNLYGRRLGAVVTGTSNLTDIFQDLDTQFSTSQNGWVGLNCGVSSNVALDVSGDVWATKITGKTQDTLFNVPYSMSTVQEFRRWTQRDIGIVPSWAIIGSLHVSPSMTVIANSNSSVYRGDDHVLFLGKTLTNSDRTSISLIRDHLLVNGTATPNVTFNDPMVTDANGNVYINGTFSTGSALTNLDGTTSSAFALPSSGVSNDAFIIQYNAAGNVQGVFTLGITCLHTNICVDSTNHMYMTACVTGLIVANDIIFRNIGGSLSPTIITASAIRLTSSTTNQWIILLKFNPAGQVTGASIASPLNSTGSVNATICTDVAANVYATLSFSTVITTKLVVFELTSSSSKSVQLIVNGPTTVVVKYSAQGGIVSISRVFPVGSTRTLIYDTYTDPYGNVYLAGTNTQSSIPLTINGSFSSDDYIMASNMSFTCNASVDPIVYLPFTYTSNVIVSTMLASSTAPSSITKTFGNAFVLKYGSTGNFSSASVFKNSPTTSTTLPAFGPGSMIATSNLLYVSILSSNTGVMSISNFTKGSNSNVAIASFAGGSCVTMFDVSGNMVGFVPFQTNTNVCSTCVDPSNNLFIGITSGGSNPIYNFNGSNSGLSTATIDNTYTITYDASGCAKKYAAIGPGIVGRISTRIDASNNVIVAGQYSSSQPTIVSRFGRETSNGGLPLCALNPTSNMGMYVIKYKYMTSSNFSAGTLLADGRILCAAASPPNTPYLFDPTDNVGRPSTVTQMGEQMSSMCLCGDGNVVIPGDTTTLYNPTTDTIITTGPIGGALYTRGARTLPDGRVFLHGLSNSAVYSSITQSLSFFSSGCGDAYTCLLPDGQTVLAVTRSSSLCVSTWDTIGMTCNTVLTTNISIGVVEPVGCTVLPDGSALLFVGSAVLRYDVSGTLTVAISEPGWGPGRLTVDGAVVCPQGRIKTGRVVANPAWVTHPAWAN